MKISIIGLGYVGLSNALLLSQYNDVEAFDISDEKIELLQKGLSPIDDKDISHFLKNKKINISFKKYKKELLSNSEFVIIATPTNYDVDKNFFDTSIVENVIKDSLDASKSSVVVIKSTIPVGFTKQLSTKYETNRLIFSPEFLREGKALFDNLHPSRIIVSNENKKSIIFANLMNSASVKKNNKILLTSSTEAESIKLFSNTYLAMRVSFFNELDSFAFVNNLDTKNIIDGVTTDPRIGNDYANPSFGYGGYCLPKDTKQMLANYKGIPQDLIGAIVLSNSTRKKFLANEIYKLSRDPIGIYRLAMKSGSDNIRESSLLDIISYLKNKGRRILIYEPLISDDYFDGSEVIKNLNKFKETSQIILTNRFHSDLDDISSKVFTRDVYGNN